EVLHYLEVMYEELPHKNVRPIIFIGRDTRPHSSRFAKLLIRACQSVACEVLVRDFGEVTTPQLHYLVRYANRQHICATVESQQYLDNTCDAFFKCLQASGAKKGVKLNGDLVVDCANGVGGIAFQQLCTLLDDTLNIHLVHIPSPEWKVNHECGAEHVQEKTPHVIGNWRQARLASVDGDCDRLIYYYVDQRNHLHILDGDKQMCLFFTFLKKFLDQANVSLTVSLLICLCILFQIFFFLQIFACTHMWYMIYYLKKVLNIEPVCTKTGVKYLHLEAIRYDVGLYFEANGHGALLIRDTAIEKLEQKLSDTNTTSKEKQAVEMLLLCHRLSNQAVGDALTGLLLVELSLHVLQWTIAQWNAIYQDRPSSLTAMKVNDRKVFETTNAEQTCVKPVGLQALYFELDNVLKKKKKKKKKKNRNELMRLWQDIEVDVRL
ncbi:hypothetical protein RFI_06739, partial [Reticulomyxa filosa]